ncbi:MAG TPA: hypothetical protein VES38_02810 [Methylotenera sp.]|nr:hypothetical protein [Methylotenera sp.]
MKNHIYFIIYIFVLFPLPSNAGTDTGSSDFGRVITPEFPGDNPCLTIESKYVLPRTAESNELVKGDIYSVLLKRVHIGTEFKADGLFVKKGELAIIANAFEMQKDKSSAIYGLDFSKSAADSGRVIYYSDDVLPGQFLNFGQLIMFGPMEYQGNPLGISLFALELDNTKKSEKVSALLTSLAELGSKFSGPISPIFGVLQELGTSLVRNNKDDLLLRYDSTIISTASAKPNLHALFGVYGEYVLIRSSEREKVINWENYSYKPSSGVLYNDSSCSVGNEYKGTYSVIQVNKATTEAHASYATLKAFKEALDNAEVGDATILQSSLDNIKVSVDQASLYRKVIRSIGAVENASSLNIPESKKVSELKKSLGFLKYSLAVQLDPANKVAYQPYLNKIQISNVLAQIEHLNKTENVINEDNFDDVKVFGYIEQNWK